MSVIEKIAKICHEVNKAYCEALGDNSQVSWEDAPQWQKDSAIAGVELHIANSGAGPDESHKSWYDLKLSEGWVFGAVKDPVLKTHPCMVPFADLPCEQQAKDYIFRQIVHSVYEVIK